MADFVGELREGSRNVIYRPARDRLIVAAPLVGILVGIVVIRDVGVWSASPVPERVRVALTILASGIIAICSLLLWAYLSASYEITADKLIVRFGPVRLQYPLSSIREAIATRVPLGPALQFPSSSNMVYIKFRPTGRVARLPLAISPANQADFLRELAERAPGIVVRGEGTSGGRSQVAD
jgi:hypothetical protein